MMEEKDTNVGEENSRKESPQLRYWRRAIYVCLFWALLFFALYTALFIFWYATVVPIVAAQALYSFKIKKYRLSLLPKKVTNRFCATRFYDRLIRKPKVDRGLGILRWIGLLLLIVGLILLKAEFGSVPVVDLDEMTLVRGTYENYQKLGRKSLCGDFILTIRLEDGSLAKFFEPGLSTFQELAKNKGMKVTLWTLASPFMSAPECRKYPKIRQIQSKVYERLYNKNRSESISRFYLITGILLSICGSVLLLYLFCYSGKVTTEYSN